MVYCLLPGGKGGFGAKLKTEGGKKVRPNENMFSKDIQGRPIAYTTTSKEYADFYRKKLQEDEKVKKQMADFSVVANTYKETYASTKLDHTYNSKLEENERQIKDAMSVGIKKYFQRAHDEQKDTNNCGNKDPQSNMDGKEQKETEGNYMSGQQQKMVKTS
jgi:hypothetical protein